jgi:hypothetical protein
MRINKRCNTFYNFIFFSMTKDIEYCDREALVSLYNSMKDSGIFEHAMNENVFGEVAVKKSPVENSHNQEIIESDNIVDDHADAVTAFCSITGGTTDAALHYLEVCSVTCHNALHSASFTLLSHRSFFIRRWVGM